MGKRPKVGEERRLREGVKLGWVVDIEGTGVRGWFGLLAANSTKTNKGGKKKKKKSDRGSLICDTKNLLGSDESTFSKCWTSGENVWRPGQVSVGGEKIFQGPTISSRGKSVVCWSWTCESKRRPHCLTKIQKR